MKTRMISWLLLLALALGVLTACTKTEETTQPTAEEVGPIQTAEPVQTDPTRAQLAAQPGVEEEDCPYCPLAEELGAALQTFVEEAGYTFETTTSTGKSTLYTVTDQGEDLVLVRVYTDEDRVDHFFVKFSYSWAASDDAFAFVGRVLKFCTKSAVEGMGNEDYAVMCQAVGMDSVQTLKAYSLGTAEFAAHSQWTLTKNTGTLKSAAYTDEAGNAYELGFYLLEKKDGDPNYFAFTVTPAKAA